MGLECQSLRSASLLAAAAPFSGALHAASVRVRREHGGKAGLKRVTTALRELAAAPYMLPQAQKASERRARHGWQLAGRRPDGPRLERG